MTPVAAARGDGPVVPGLPHTGAHGPEGVMARMEPAQDTHLMPESLPFDYDPVGAARLRPHLAAILHPLEDYAFTQGATR